MHGLNWTMAFYIDNLKAVSQVEKEKRYIAEEINLSGNPEVLRVRTAGCIVLTQK